MKFNGELIPTEDGLAFVGEADGTGPDLTALAARWAPGLEVVAIEAQRLHVRKKIGPLTIDANVKLAIEPG